MAAEFCACRLALSALGVDAYGCLAAIYAIIAAFEMFNGAFEATSQRFLGIELGKGEDGDIGRAFSSILALAMFFCLGIALLAETAGFWFLAHRLVLSDGASGYVVLVYQIGVIAVLVRILQLPFTSLVLSGERMTFFSKVCWMEAAFSVAAAVLARQGPVAYVFTRLCGNVTVFFLFVIHCRRIFPQIRPRPRICPGWSSAQVRFFLWSALSGIGNAFKYQGVGLVVNRYSGVAFNASFNLALKVRTLFLPLCMNILQAVAPAVYKARGRGDSRRFETLVGRSLALAIVLVAVPSSVKCVIRQAMMFEYRIGKGRLLVCSFNFRSADPAAVWLRARLCDYAASDDFNPSHSLTPEGLHALLSAPLVTGEGNPNAARNPNDPSSDVRAGESAQP